MRPLLSTLLFLCGLAGCASPPPGSTPENAPAPASHPAPEDLRFLACRDVMLAQTAAWNRGDLEAFADGYHRSPHTVFSSANGSSLGFDAMLQRYRESYPDRASMGTLEFSDLRFEVLAENEVLARGRWQLVRNQDAPWGRFALVLRQIDGSWQIVLDYTTSGS